MTWTILWILWIVAFIVIELAAILNDTKDDTLSEHFRKWFRTETKPGRTVWLIVSGIFVAWFLVHIAVAGAA